MLLKKIHKYIDSLRHHKKIGEPYRQYLYPKDIFLLTLMLFLKHDINKIYLITDKLFAGADTFVTSLILGKTIGNIGMADIILCGKSSDDSGTAQIGPSLAERLKYQFINNISSLEITGNCIRCESALGNIRHEIKAELPIIGTIDIPPVKNKYPSLRNIIKQKKDVTVFNAKDIGISKNQTQSKTKVMKLFPYEKSNNGEFIQGNLSDKAARFIDVIKRYN